MKPPAKTNLIVPLTQTDVPAMRAAMRQAAAAGADMVECRLDFLSACDSAAVQELLRDRPLPAIVTCRPVRQGGLYHGDETARLALLQKALDLGAEYVDVECDVPPSHRPGVTLSATATVRVAQPPSAVKSGRIILSFHDFSAKPANLPGILADLAAQQPSVCKIAFAAKGAEDAIDALAALRSCPSPAFVLAMNEAGLASRVLAKKFDAFGTFASLAAGSESAPGQPTIEQIKQLYRWDSIGPATAVYGLVGCPVAHSMGPTIHNTAFAAKDLDAVYLPLRVEPGEDNFRAFMDTARQPWLNLAGLSVTLPHKENALRYVGLDNVDELSRRIGAINTIAVGPDGRVRGTNTDYAGAIDALTSAMSIAREGLHGLRCGVLGAGGVSRAIVAALRHYGADVVIYNRTAGRAQAIADEFSCRWAARDAVGSEPLDILINGTSVGMHPNVDSMPLPEESLAHLAKVTPGLVVFDTIYNPVQTRLLARAEGLSCRCVSGVEMFVNQAMGQFTFWTGLRMERQPLREIVLQRLYAAR